MSQSKINVGLPENNFEDLHSQRDTKTKRPNNFFKMLRKNILIKKLYNLMLLLLIALR